jgi:histidyl-tRNA synthetase
VSEGKVKKHDRQKFQAVRGTRDILPPESALWNRVEQAAREVFASYGYGEIRLPLFEQTELFARSIGAETDVVNKEMYVFDLHGSIGLQYLRESIPKYPEELSMADFERRAGEFVRQVEEALRTDRLQKTQVNLVAIEKAKSLHGKFRLDGQQSQSSEWSTVAENFWDAIQDIDLGLFVALRPEATASVVRAYIEHGMQTLPGDVKLYCIGPMFRRERPQKGRYRQFYQIDAEVLGQSDNPGIDAELIEMLLAFLNGIGLKGTVLSVNSIGDRECRPKYVEQLRTALRQVKDKLGPDSQRRIETNPLRVLDSKVPEEQPVIEKLPRIAEHLCDACRNHYAELKRQLALRSIAYQESWRLVRGLDYYMRTTFEVTATGLGSQDAVCGGGRYDGLVELLGGPAGTKGIGFAIGTDRVILSLQEQSGGIPERKDVTVPLTGLEMKVSAGSVAVGTKPDVFLAWMGAEDYPVALELAQKLRAQGIALEVPAVQMKLGKSLNLADRRGARYAVIIGDEERLTKEFTLRELLPHGKAKTFPDKGKKLSEAELIPYLKSELGKQ